MRQRRGISKLSRFERAAFLPVWPGGKPAKLSERRGPCHGVSPELFGRAGDGGGALGAAGHRGPGRDLLHRSGTAQKFEQFDAGESILQGIVPPGSGGNLFKAVKQPLETAAIHIEKHIDRVETAFPQKPFQQFAFHGDRELVTALPRSHQKFAVDLRLHQEDLSGFHNSPDAPLTDQQRSFADIFHRKGRNTPAPVVRSGQKLHLVTPFTADHLLLDSVNQKRQCAEEISPVYMAVHRLPDMLRPQLSPLIETTGVVKNFHMGFFQISGVFFP